MFTSDRVLTATRMRKYFSSIARRIRKEGMPFLVTQKGNKSLVLVEADRFEELVHFQYEAQRAGFEPSVDWND
ncbi:MAG: hypothetical protein J5J00_15875 [Deltaproteobacteria bacterium]|nr:hypothetical protein [Deltaproteobacteria bacterium]